MSFQPLTRLITRGQKIGKISDSDQIFSQRVRKMRFKSCQIVLTLQAFDSFKWFYKEIHYYVILKCISKDHLVEFVYGRKSANKSKL